MKEYIVRCESEKITFDREIVRCKDCIHRNWKTKGCKRNPSVEGWLDDDFCNYGIKQVTGKLESVEKATSEGDESTMGQPKSKLYIPREKSKDCKEQKSKVESDLISRQAAIEAVEKAVFKGVAKSAIESLPPVNQKQITGKLKNPCDSLFTEDSEGVKEQKSKLESEKLQLSPETSTNEGVAESATNTDCISRADAINVRCAHCDTRDCCRDCSEVEILLSLPPVEPKPYKESDTE